MRAWRTVWFARVSTYNLVAMSGKETLIHPEAKYSREKGRSCSVLAHPVHFSIYSHLDHKHTHPTAVRSAIR